MLEKISPREFEEWCKILLERAYDCQVEDTVFAGDEGRDLIVHHSTGKIVVECKHQPNTSIGRPVIQKLHSAVLTAGARKGIVITTGRFSKAAIEYASGLEIEIELIDRAKLSYMAEKVGLSADYSQLDDKTAQAILTMSDTQFSSTFPDRIFAEPRYNPGRGFDLSASVNRTTLYEGVFLAKFTAYGELQTADGTKSASWTGLVWTSLDGFSFGIGEPSATSIRSAKLVQLGEALQVSPGPTQPPKIQPHEAASRMKEYLLQELSELVTYTGRNNVTYTREIKPSSRSTDVTNVRLVYLPKQSFTLRFGKIEYTGDVIEDGNEFLVFSNTLSTCCICKRAVSEENQVFCAICHRPAHARSFLTPDSFRCKRCNATICYDHSLQDNHEIVCTRCSTQTAKKPRKRWLPHMALGWGMTVFLAAIIGAIPSSMSGYAFLMSILSVSWFPLVYVATKGDGKGNRNGLKY